MEDHGRRVGLHRHKIVSDEIDRNGRFYDRRAILFPALGQQIADHRQQIAALCGQIAVTTRSHTQTPERRRFAQHEAAPGMV